jgi:hypothetical protein
MEGIDPNKYTYHRLLEENEAAKKRAEEEKAAATALKRLEIKLVAEKQAAEKASPKKLNSSGHQGSRSLRRHAMSKMMSEEDRAKMREKMRKLEDLAAEDDWAAPLPDAEEAQHVVEDTEYDLHQAGDEVIRPTSRSSDAFRGGTPILRPPSASEERGSSGQDGLERDQERQAADSDDDSEVRARSRRNQARALRNLRSSSSRDLNSRTSLASASSTANKPGSPGFVSDTLRSSTQRRILSRGTPKSVISSGGVSEGGLGETCEPPAEDAQANTSTMDAAEESNYTDIPDWHKFFGPNAKIEFRRKYRKIYRFLTSELPT